MVCSTDEPARLPAVWRVAEAIDRLEADHRAGRGNADFSDLEARIAEIWAMVRELDPQLSRLASKYTDFPG